MRMLFAVLLILVCAVAHAEPPVVMVWTDLLAKERSRTANQTATDTFDLHAGIVRFARSANLAPELVAAIVLIESNADPCAVSSQGAMGLMQLMPATATQLGINDPFEPAQNLAAGTQYLRLMLDKANGNIWQAAAMYNAGPGVLNRPLSKWPAETVRYVGQRLKMTLARLQRQSWREGIRASIPRVNRRLCGGRHQFAGKSRKRARPGKRDLLSLLVWWERQDK